MAKILGYLELTQTTVELNRVNIDFPYSKFTPIHCIIQVDSKTDQISI